MQWAAVLARVVKCRSIEQYPFRSGRLAGLRICRIGFLELPSEDAVMPYELTSKAPTDLSTAAESAGNHGVEIMWKSG